MIYPPSVTVVINNVIIVNNTINSMRSGLDQFINFPDTSKYQRNSQLIGFNGPKVNSALVLMHTSF